ncbi:Ankyrin repeat and zinc finger domain-containing protein 1 [Sparganum proliferum]
MGGQKSAGSSLRRYGEQAIRSDIAHLLHVKWRPYLQACQLILTWTPKVHRGIFFTPPTSSEAPIREEDTEEQGGSNGDEGRPVGAGSNLLPPPPPPDHLAADAVAARVGVVHNDLRLRRLPCRAKNITYAHVKELQREFSSFRVFDSLADYDLIRQSERKQLEQMANSEGQTVYESKSGRLFFGNIPLVQKESTLRTAGVSESSEETTSEEGGHDLDEHNRSTPESGSPDQQEVSQVTEPGPLSSLQLATPKRKSRRKAASSRKLAAVRDLSSESEEPVVAASRETSKAADLARLCTTYSVWHRSIRMAIAVGDMERLKALLPEAGCVQLAETRADRRDSKPGNSETNGEHPFIPPTTTNQTTRKSGFWAMRANLEAARNSTSAAAAAAPASLDPSMPIPSSEDATQLLNYRLSDGRSLLHLAVELQGDPDVIHMLLSSGCRPDCPDVHGMTPYRLAGQLGKSKFSACFRKFRKAYPDRYDYEKAQIPCGPDPPPASSTKYSPTQRSRPRRTQTEVKNAASVLTQSAADRKPIDELKFAGLSMREKCALAAERRIAAAQGAAAAAASTVSANPVGYCCQCSTDLTGRQPFTYNDFRFCSPSCLRTHRLGANR